MLKRNPIALVFISLAVLGLLSLVLGEATPGPASALPESLDQTTTLPREDWGRRKAEANRENADWTTGNGVASSIDYQASCQVELIAIDRYTQRPISGCKFELIDTESLVRKSSTSNAAGISVVDGLKPGNYGVEATREGYLVAHSSCTRGFVDIPGTKRVEFLFQEPHVCAFKINGPKAYAIRFSESGSNPVLYSKSKQLGRLETDLAKQHEAYVQVHLLDDPASNEPEHVVALFYQQGVLTRRLRFVPLGLFSGPEVIDVGASIVEPPASASIAFTCLDPLGHAVDLGPIKVQRKEAVHGFLTARIESNGEGLVPAGDYQIGLNHTIAPWIVAQELDGIGRQAAIHLIADQRLEVHVRLSAAMSPVTVMFPSVDVHQATLTLGARFGGKLLRGCGIPVKHGQVVQVPPSVEVASLYSGGKLIGTVESSAWVGSGEMLFKREVK